MVQYLYNSRGEWIAFEEDGNVFDPQGRFIGWMAEDGENVLDIENRYFATIYPDHRLYRKLFAPATEATFTNFPGPQALPNFPALPGPVQLPIEADDVPELTAA